MKKEAEVKYDHIVTIENGHNLSHVARVPSSKMQRKEERINRYYSFLIDLLFCCFVSILWITTLNFFARFLIYQENGDHSPNQYLYLSLFVVMLAICMCCIYFDNFCTKEIDKLKPKIAIVVKKNQTLKSHILRVRLFGGKEFVETELDETKLTYDQVLELCYKELNLEKNKIEKLWKVPETRIRNDNDIKRFRRLEYIEVHTVD